MSGKQGFWIILAVVIVVAAGVAYAKAIMPESDQSFLTEAIKGDNSEIALGQLAAQKGNSEGVRSFGQTLAQDHAQAKSDALAVAQKLNVSPPDDVTDEAARERQKLEGLSGGDFDEEFISYMINDHKKDIGEFQKQAKAENTDTAGLARQTLPALQKHLDMAQKLKE